MHQIPAWLYLQRRRLIQQPAATASDRQTQLLAYPLQCPGTSAQRRASPSFVPRRSGSAGIGGRQRQVGKGWQVASMPICRLAAGVQCCRHAAPLSGSSLHQLQAAACSMHKKIPEHGGDPCRPHPPNGQRHSTHSGTACTAAQHAPLQSGRRFLPAALKVGGPRHE